MGSTSYLHLLVIIRIWDPETGALVKPKEGHTGPLRIIAYSPDGRCTILGSNDGAIQIWDAKTGATVCSPRKGCSDIVWSIASSPDGRCIVSKSSDGPIRIWDAEAGVVVRKSLEGHTHM